MTYFIYVLVQLYLIYINDSAQCTNSICFKWRVSTNKLTLTCRIGCLYHRVSIIDPIGRLQADCLPPFPKVLCHGFYRNVSIRQNSQTNETIYVVRGTIDFHLNGNWTCHHGIRSGVAKVEVNILQPKDVTTAGGEYTLQTTTSKYSELDCMKDSLLLSMIGFFLSVMVSMLISTFLKYHIRLLEVAINKCYQQDRGFSKRKDTILNIKTTLFWLCALGYCVASVTVGLYSGNNCRYKFVLPVIGPFWGFVSSCLCLNRYAKANQEHAATVSETDIELGPLHEQTEA